MWYSLGKKAWSVLGVCMLIGALGHMLLLLFLLQPQ